MCLQIVRPEIPALLGKACEAFIIEITYLAWYKAKIENNNAINPIDIAKVLIENPSFDFIHDIAATKIKEEEEKVI